MPRHYDYIEWDEKAADAARRRADEGAVESLYDREIRTRIGELIARAMQAANSAKH